MKKITNRILPPALIAALLVLAMSISALAENHAGNNDWLVTFTADKKMSSNFQSKVWDDNLTGLQPGDYTDLTVKIKNDNENTTDWYMTNKVIHSLEDTRKDDNGLVGGAYTYVLKYQGNDGSAPVVLYSSDKVGGGKYNKDAGEGLHEATNALDNWFYLDTLKNGEGGTVTLRVGLDGETQGNDYQDTLADLEMNFAVELRTTEENKKKIKDDDDDDDDDDNDNKKKNTSSTSTTKVVKTGDYTDTLPYLIAAGISGLILLILAFYSLQERRRQRGGRS